MTKKVMCFGTFDLLHLGHLNYFKQAKKYGDYLIVVVARDKTKLNQNKAVVFTERERLELIKSLKIVDEAVLGHVGNHLKVIVEKKSDVICLGYDHNVKEESLSKKLSMFGFNPRIIRMKPYHLGKNKSSRIKELVLGKS